MRVANRNLPWSLMPLFLAGVLCNTWSVVYHQPHICAVNGSYVVIPCSFYYPDTKSVKTVMWLYVKPPHVRTRLIYDRKSNKDPRVQYIGDKKHNCSLKIHQVEHNDAGKYTFRFITNSKEGKWTGRVSSTVKVVDLNVSMTQPDGNGTTKEGDSVNLTCLNVCDAGPLSSAFTWCKNGEPIKEGPVLYISNMSSTNSGNYTCSLKTNTGTTSGVINIDVEYGPKNTLVSVRPSMEEDAGSSNTLICSSHANPPVEKYTWFKIDDDDDDDDEDFMDVEHRPEFLPAVGGQYLCSATNKHGSQNSSIVTLKMKPYWATFTRDVCIIATAAVLLNVITGIALRRLHKTMMWTPKTDSEEDTQVVCNWVTRVKGESNPHPKSLLKERQENTENTDYVNWLACDNNQSQEGNQWEGGTAEVVYTTVYFENKTKSNMEQQMDSHTDDDDDEIYISVKKPTVEPFIH